MRMKESDENKLIRISLQFFGESGDDFDDDFGYEDEDGYEDGADEEGYEEDVDEGADEEGSAGAEGGAGAGATDHADLVADLKALGFVGDDLAAIKASVKARREAKDKGDAAEERTAAQAAGKAHIKGSKPRKGAGGDGTGGVTERQVVGFAERAGCTKEEARKLLTKHSRMINK